MDLDPAELEGTAASLAASATKAGYTIRAEKSEIGSLRLTGTMSSWAFSAIFRTSGKWDVGQRRPGWPDAVSDVTALRRTFTAQTPVVIGKAPRR